MTCCIAGLSPNAAFAAFVATVRVIPETCGAAARGSVVEAAEILHDSVALV